MGVGVAVFAAAASLGRLARAAKDGSRAVLGVASVLTGMTGLAPIAFLGAFSMTTDLEAEGIHVSMSPGPHDEVVPYAEVVDVQVRRYDPIREYGGWGVRGGRHGRALSCTGDRGVQLELRGGRHLLLGSQRAEALAAAIAARLGASRQNLR